MFSLPSEMVDVYLQRRIKDLECLQNSLKENSVEEFNRIGHQLVGNAKNFGFDSLEPLAHRMEKLKSSELLRSGPELLREFSTWLDEQLKNKRYPAI